jgi:transcriptional regulator with XRE-family HTH domain
MKTHRQYVNEQIKKHPKFAEDLAEAERDVAIAVELARLRERRRLSQTEVARMTGMKQSQIARVERGVHMPALGTLLKLLTVLGGTLELGPRRCRITAAPGKVVGLRRRQFA